MFARVTPARSTAALFCAAALVPFCEFFFFFIVLLHCCDLRYMYCVILQSRFERPVLVGQKVDARVQVEQARVTSSGREVLVRCSTAALLADGTVAVSGQAKVLLPRSCDVRSW